MKRRKLTALLLAGALAVGLMAAPVSVIVPDSAYEVVAASKASKEKAYGTPWINSNAYGNAKKVSKPSLKDDFYLSVNYDKFKKGELRPGHTSEGTLESIGETVEKRLRALMTDESITDSNAALVREYYQMFLDWGSRNAAARDYFEKHFKPVKDISDLTDLTGYLKTRESHLFGESLFSLEIDIDRNDPNSYILSIGSTPLSLDDAAEYENETNYGARVKKAETERATYVLKYAGYSDEEISAIIQNSFDFEKMIASSMMTTEDRNSEDSVDMMNNPRTPEQLRAESTNLPLMDIIDALGYGGMDHVNLTEPKWLAKLNELYTEENFVKIKDYLIMHFASDHISDLDEAAYRERQRISREMNGLSESREDEYYAYADTQSTLYNFVDQMYVQKYCSPEMKQDVKKIMVDIVGQYKKMLRNEKWLDVSTRKAAIKKLNNIGLYAVYPDKWEDWSNVTFRTRAEGGSYQEANDSIIEALFENNVEELKKPVDNAIWHASCTDVNASYWPSFNRILVYAGILNGAVYNESMSEEEKLGSIGTIIGHEISHAFDSSGSQFDENGKVSEWYTVSDRKEYKKKVNKLIKYYDTIVPFKDGTHYNGTIVQGEAVADLGGVKCMLLMASKKKHFDYDKFFRAYARVWYDYRSEETMENIYLQNEHPINYLRVNVVLSQYDEFQKTYNIKEGDGMYVAPKDRIAVW